MFKIQCFITYSQEHVPNFKRVSCVEYVCDTFLSTDQVFAISIILQEDNEEIQSHAASFVIGRFNTFAAVTSAGR